MILERKAIRMSVYPEFIDEYEKRHQDIGDALKQALFDCGVHSYSIFLDKETCHLFAYLEVENKEKLSKISNTDACKKWWAKMKDIMPSNPDNSPIEVELKEVFHLSSE